MDQVTKVRRYLKREQWKTLIKECQSSGMTVTAWCKINGICEQTYLFAGLEFCISNLIIKRCGVAYGR